MPPCRSRSSRSCSRCAASSSTSCQGVAETIEWTRALLALDAVALEPEIVNNTLGVLLKYQDDIARMQGTEAAKLVERIREEARALAPVRS